MPTITQHGELQRTEPSADAPLAGAVAGCQPVAQAWPRDPSAEAPGRGSGQGVAEHSRHSREAFSAGSSSLRLVLERAHLFLVDIYLPMFVFMGCTHADSHELLGLSSPETSANFSGFHSLSK